MGSVGIKLSEHRPALHTCDFSHRLLILKYSSRMNFTLYFFSLRATDCCNEKACIISIFAIKLRKVSDVGIFINTAVFYYQNFQYQNHLQPLNLLFEGY